MQPLDDAPELVERTARVTAATLAELLSAAPPPLLLDVRTEREWRAGRIDGATNIPLSRLAHELASVPSASPLVAYCASGCPSVIESSSSTLTLTGAASAARGRAALWLR